MDQLSRVQLGSGTGFDITAWRIFGNGEGWETRERKLWEQHAVRKLQDRAKLYGRAGLDWGGRKASAKAPFIRIVRVFPRFLFYYYS